MTSQKKYKASKQHVLRDDAKQLLELLEKRQSDLVQYIRQLGLEDQLQSDARSRSSAAKSVSFHDYLRTSSSNYSTQKAFSSPQLRRAHSATSIYTNQHKSESNKEPTKSILKKSDRCSLSQAETLIEANRFSEMNPIKEARNHKSTSLAAEKVRVHVSHCDRESFLKTINVKRREQLNHSYEELVSNGPVESTNNKEALASAHLKGKYDVSHWGRSNTRSASACGSKKKDSTSRKALASANRFDNKNINKQESTAKAMCHRKNKEYKKMAKLAKKKKTLLGYDWALGRV
jgi:hypothetical protein